MIHLRRAPSGSTRHMVLGVLLLAGCTDYDSDFVIVPHDPDNLTDPFCSIATEEIFRGGPGKDGIPALSDPRLVRAEDAEASYLQDDDRVVGVLAGVDAVAVPLRILWYHEIVNMALAGREFAITHCPLTGSSIAFDRTALGGVEFGVSGLLYRNNLMMYDRSDEESLWPQMSRGARCGVRDGTGLDVHPVIETTWGAWKELQPNGWVVSSETGHDRRYHVDPYGDYSEIDNQDVSYPVVLDFRRPLKERVLGVVDDAGGVAYPFGALEDVGDVAVVPHRPGTSAGDAVVFWDAGAHSAMAYARLLDGNLLTFEVTAGEITDVATRSVWGVDGVARSGPWQGRRLEPVAEAYVSFWFAWAAFEPSSTLWEGL